MPIDSEFMDVFDAATLLGVHVQTLRKLARQKKIPSFKVGRDWRFRKEALLRWADEQHRVGTGGNGCSVLVIDDDEKVCTTLVRILQGFGCDARPASSGRRGLELISEETPDLILLDLQMPGMNGVEFLGELREAHPALPVIIVTGYPNGELMKEAAHFAPVMLLPKPVERGLLERTMRTVVGEKLPSGTMAAPGNTDGRNP